MKKKFALLAFLLCAVGMSAQNDYINGLSIWFDQPTTLNGRALWYGGRPDLWVGKGKPAFAFARRTASITSCVCPDEETATTRLSPSSMDADMAQVRTSLTKLEEMPSWIS